MPVHTVEEELLLKKKGGINQKNIRIMTPTEWGRLQGFIGYGFVDEETGEDRFGFPDNVPESQRYKQFGNSVSISVIETIADYIYEQLSSMNQNYEIVLRNLEKREKNITRRMVSECLHMQPERASYILKKMENCGLIYSEGKGRTTKYHFM